MPVYFITLHAYRSWNADHPRGYVEDGKGILPPNPERAGQYDRAARHARVSFDTAMQQVLVDGSREMCERRDWRCHGVATEPTHIHVLISWQDEATSWQSVRDTLKRVLGFLLSQRAGEKSRRWWVRKGSRKRVRDRDHLDYLLDTYLLKHAGVGWTERIGYFNLPDFGEPQ